MLGSLEFLVLIIAVPVSAIYGAIEGKRCGYQNITLPGTFLRGYFRGALASSLVTYVAIVTVGLYSATDRGGMNELLRLLSSGLIIAAIFGLIVSIIPAPIAAFIAYNFGARKRAEEEITKNSLADDPIDEDPSAR